MTRKETGSESRDYLSYGALSLGKRIVGICHRKSNGNGDRITDGDSDNVVVIVER